MSRLTESQRAMTAARVANLQTDQVSQSAAADMLQVSQSAAAEGESNREIAAVLGVAKDTVNRDVNGANAPQEKPDATETRADIGVDGAPEIESGANSPPNPLASLAFAEAAQDAVHNHRADGRSLN